MKKNHSVKGMIPVALAFVIVLSLVLVVTTGIFWTKVRLSVSRLKRYQAINCARTALYEFAHRTWNPGDTAWDDDTAGITAPAAGTVDVEGIPVTITVDTSGSRIKVSATVDYGHIRL